MVKIWQQQMRRRRCLTDSAGESVEVVYPGRLNDGRGADFRDAVVISGGESRHGCIEVHTKTGGWQAHGHHRDPVYNEVILHVALESTPGWSGETRLQNGKVVPTVLLAGGFLAEAPENNPDLGCREAARRRGPENLLNALDEAGDQRFASKASGYRRDLAVSEAGQSLYRGLLEALGYSKNKLPFGRLADRAPLNFLAGILKGDRSADQCLMRLQASVLGSAGFLPSQRGLRLEKNDYIEHLEQIWETAAGGESLVFAEWELFKVRPGNHPIRRTIALSYLLQRFREKGWLASLLDLVGQAPLTAAWSSLKAALTVEVKDGYWLDHYDFGPANPAVGPVLLGRERADEIIINVLLPFSRAWSEAVQDPVPGQKAGALYARYPRLETNSIERHMIRQLGLDRRQVNSARRQQGLLHIYKTFCTHGKCTECPLS